MHVHVCKRARERAHTQTLFSYSHYSLLSSHFLLCFGLFSDTPVWFNKISLTFMDWETVGLLSLSCFEALVSFHGFLHPHSQHSGSGMSAASPKPLPPPLPVHLFLDLSICVHGVVGEGLFLLTGCACQYHFPSPGSLWLLLTLLSRVHGWTPRGSDNPISTKEKLRRNSVMWALSNLVILLYHIVLITQVLLFLPVEKADKLQDNLTALLGLADVDIHQPPIPSSIGERVALP